MVSPLTIVDVGARWGVAERWSALAPDLRVYGFDPDPEECERLNAALGDTGGDRITEYVPSALAATAGTMRLHVTAEPACSSMYPPVARLSRVFRELECIEQTDRIEVNVTTLDMWCADHDVEVIDFLKLDTQGSELGVLQGAERMLGSVLVLEIEVEFNPIYEGQPLFADIDGFLRARGFVLWRLDHLTHYSTEGPAGDDVRGISLFDSVPHETMVPGGQLYWGHAYFVRRELCADSDQSPSAEQRRRGAAVARAGGLADLARQIVNLTPRLHAGVT